jgi:hypothetical protein
MAPKRFLRPAILNAILVVLSLLVSFAVQPVLLHSIRHLLPPKPNKQYRTSPAASKCPKISNLLSVLGNQTC